MKYLLLITSLVFYKVAAGQSASGPPLRKPVVNAWQPAAAVQDGTEQRRYWEAVLQKNKHDATAWLNYYLWAERSREPATIDQKERLHQIANDAANNISATAEYALIRYLQSGKKDNAALQRALAVATDKTLVYPYAIQYEWMRHNVAAVKKYCHAFNQLQPLSTAIREYHYNVLMSADSNGTIYAKSYNDLVPLLVLQQEFKVRTDVRLVLFSAMQTVPSGVYVCLGSGREIIAQYKDACYTGLLVKTACKADEQTLLQHLHSFDFAYLKSAFALDENAAVLYRNYIPAFIIAYKSFTDKQQPEAVQYLQLLHTIGAATNLSEAINKALQ